MFDFFSILVIEVNVCVSVCMCGEVLFCSLYRKKDVKNAHNFKVEPCLGYV